MKTINKIISGACVIFTVTEFVLLIISHIVLSAEGKSEVLVNFLGLKAAVIIFVTALIFSIAGLILKAKRVPGFVLRLIHFVVTVITLEIALLLVMSGFRARVLLVIGFAYTVLYIIVTLILYFIKRIRLNKKEETEEYTPVFDNVKK